MPTVVFAVYVVGLLGALLTVGSLSDKLGRRALIIGIGVGPTFNGNLHAIGAVTTVATRSATFAGVYLVSDVSHSAPSLLAAAAIHSMSGIGRFVSGRRRNRSGTVADRWWVIQTQRHKERRLG